MQKRVKTYGKHSSRIITLSEDKSITIPHNTATSITQPTFKNHVSLSESSDNLPIYPAHSRRTKVVLDPEGNINKPHHRKPAKAQPHDPAHNAKAPQKREIPAQKRMEGGSNRKGDSRYEAGPSQHRIIDKPKVPTRSMASQTHASKELSSNKPTGDEKIHKNVRQKDAELSDSTDSMSLAKPSARVARARRRYIVSDESESSSFESTSEAEEPSTSSSSAGSPSPAAKAVPNGPAMSPPSKIRGQGKLGAKVTPKNAPPAKPATATSSVRSSARPDQKAQAIQISSDSESPQSDVSNPRAGPKGHDVVRPFAGTPQVKASHLRQARFRKATPFRCIPRISLASSTLTLSPVSPLNFTGSKKQAIVPVSKAKALKLDSPPFTPLPPSSPLTWDESLTPEAVRNLNLSSEVEVKDASALALQSLLKFANQSEPVDFVDFLDNFRTHDIDNMCSNGKRDKVRTAQRASMKYRKIGDASYSEVFAIGEVVLKVIPLAVKLDREEDGDSDEGEDEDEDAPFRSPPENVLKEIMITKATGDAVEGFIKLLKTYIVKGKYPRLLLKEWDEFNRNRGSYGTRPDCFTENQLYTVVVLPNGGIDLETYAFSKTSSSAGASKGSTGWRDAAEVFWQVTAALAKAEGLLKFEHRDLHWGQIVMRKTTPVDAEQPVISATIIDLGLSRIETDGIIQFTSFEEDVFTGAGIIPGSDCVIELDENMEPDYQFDIYRLMRHYNEDDWTSYRPLTNIMWLHYLSLKLLRDKGLRKPSPNPRQSTTHGRHQDSSVELPHLESEWHAYQQLAAVEQCLGSRLEKLVESMVQKRGKGKLTAKARKHMRPVKSTSDATSKQSPMPIESAGDVAVLWFAKAW